MRPRTVGIASAATKPASVSTSCRRAEKSAASEELGDAQRDWLRQRADMQPYIRFSPFRGRGRPSAAPLTR